MEEMENGKCHDPQPCLLRQFLQGPAWSVLYSTWGLVCLNNKPIQQDEDWLPGCALQLICLSQAGSRTGGWGKGLNTAWPREGKWCYRGHLNSTERAKRSGPVTACCRAACPMWPRCGWKWAGDCSGSENECAEPTAYENESAEPTASQEEDDGVGGEVPPASHSPDLLYQGRAWTGLHYVLKPCEKSADAQRRTKRGTRRKPQDPGTGMTQILDSYSYDTLQDLVTLSEV